MENTLYTYNALGERIKKINQNGLTTRFHYSPSGQLLYEQDTNGNTKAYVWLDGRPLARIDNDASIYYYHVDHLGTPQVMTDSTGAIVWKADYDPFGKASVRVSTIENNLRLPGQYYDRETGLHYNYFRDYDSSTGRYVEADPIGLDGGMNLYGYVGGNPISFVDPLGLASLVFNNGTLTVIGSNGNIIATRPAGNNTTKPSGDPNIVGSNGPAPRGTFPVQPPVNTTGRPEYGSAFFPVGAVGPNGRRLDIARRRGIGVHSGRRGYQSRTQGCIRVDESTIQELLQINQNDPITEITIQ